MIYDFDFDTTGMSLFEALSLQKENRTKKLLDLKLKAVIRQAVKGDEEAIRELVGREASYYDMMKPEYMYLAEDFDIDDEESVDEELYEVEKKIRKTREESRNKDEEKYEDISGLLCSLLDDEDAIVLLGDLSYIKGDVGIISLLAGRVEDDRLHMICTVSGDIAAADTDATDTDVTDTKAADKDVNNTDSDVTDADGAYSDDLSELGYEMHQAMMDELRNRALKRGVNLIRACLEEGSAPLSGEYMEDLGFSRITSDEYGNMVWAAGIGEGDAPLNTVIEVNVE